MKIDEKVLLFFFAVAIFAFATNVNADVITFDNFDYPDGPLVGNGGWVNHSGGPDDLLVSGGQVVVQHGTPSEDANLPFTGISGNVYYGINFSVDDPGGPITGTDNEYFAHSKTPVASTFRRAWTLSGQPRW